MKVPTVIDRMLELKRRLSQATVYDLKQCIGMHHSQVHMLTVELENMSKSVTFHV